MNPKPSSVGDSSRLLPWIVLFFSLVADASGQPGPIILPAQPRVGQALPMPFAVAANNSSNEDLADNIFLPPDRRTLQKLTQARELISRGRYGEAVQNLGAILEGPEDYFFQPQINQPLHRSLKVEAQNLIGQMPADGRELYELEFGAKARRLLETAVAEGDAQKLAEVSRRFFHTRAGYDATFLLGFNHLDHGSPLAGALTLQRLADAGEASERFEPALSLAMATGWLQSGAPDKARRTLVAFRRAHPQLAMKVGDGTAALFEKDDDALDWLMKLVGTAQIAEVAGDDRWLMFRGNAQRNAVAGASAPLLDLCWESPATDDPMVEETVEQTRRGILERGLAVLPGLHPLVVDDAVLVRTYGNLQALDFASGKRLWEVPGDDSPDNSTAGGENDPNLQASMTAAALSHRALSDATFGTLSSDGRLVFAIEDVGSAQSVTPGRRVTTFATVSKVCNRLAAYDIHSGKLKWQLGGDVEDYGVRLPEAYFLGPPLPLMGQLYVLAETKGEIRLLALDAGNGNVSWSQQLLAVVEQNAQQTPTMLRISGVSPSYSDGILVCPTSAGALVAVELANRSLLWGYRYPHDYQPDQMERMLGSAEAGLIGNRAADGSVCIADGKVLVTPSDCDSLFCLNLIDGDLQWKYKRQDDVYVAGVHQGQVVMVGRHHVRAIRLADGKPGWDGRVISLPEGAMPSGRGFLSGDRYFLPLDSAEVAAIDLTKGDVIHYCKSRKGVVPGNLVCYKGRVISQSYEGVDVFYQIDTLSAEVQKRLEANPADADALCMQGEILLDAGKRQAAIDCFRRSYAADADPHSRELLRDALFEGLQQEFAAYRGQTAEIERLLEDSSQRGDYLRLMIAGLHQSGDPAAAFEQCQKLIDLDTDTPPLETAGKSLSVRRDRWIQAQVASLALEAKGETAEKIAAAIRDRYETAKAEGSIESLARLLAYFGNQPIAAEARVELVRKLIQARRMLEAEIAIWECHASADPAANPPALAEVAAMLRETGLRRPAAATYDWLRRRFGNVVCGDGKTGEQLVNDLPVDDGILKFIDHKDSWPVGNVETSAKDARNQGINNFGRLQVEFKGSRGPYFENVNLTFDQNRRILLAADGLGNELWKIILDDEHMRRQPYNPGFAHARALGHLLLFSAGGNVCAIDTLRSREGSPPRVLWSQSIGDASGETAELQPFFQQIPVAGGVPLRIVQMYVQGRDLEAVTARYVCIQRARSIIALDPFTGAILWKRDDIPPGSIVFGDEDYVFVVPPDKPEALVLRALNGESVVGTRKIPRTEIVAGNTLAQSQRGYSPLSDSCPMILGRNLLFWRLEQNHRVLELFDPWTQQAVWPRREFSFHAQYAILGNEAIGVLEPKGSFVLLNLADGRPIAELDLKGQPHLSELTLMAWGDQFLVLAHDSYQEANAPPRPLQPVGGSSKQVLKGRLYAIGRDGKLLWPEPVEIKEQQLPTGQPQGLPILLFACQRFELKQNSPGRAVLSVLGIDKRSGRVAYKNDFPRPSGFFNVLGNAEDKTVNLTMQYQTVTLTFTDKPPLPPEKQEEAAKNAQQPRANASRALLKSLEKTMGQMLGLPQDDSLDDEEP
jgi:outer membrane protein assembly factor BamB/tetratricopeptide (TPR) repeat protein